MEEAPLRLRLVDLSGPVSFPLMQILSALESMEEGEGLLLMVNQDPQPLLDQLRPVLDSGYEWQLMGQGPEVWRIMIYSGSASSHV